MPEPKAASPAAPQGETGDVLIELKANARRSTSGGSVRQRCPGGALRKRQHRRGSRLFGLGRPGSARLRSRELVAYPSTQQVHENEGYPVTRRVRTSPCTGLPRRGRRGRRPRRWPWSSGRGTGSSRSSTELTELISAAVPQTNISSAMYRSLRARLSTRHVEAEVARRCVITEFWVMPSSAPADSGGVMMMPLRDGEDVLAGALGDRARSGPA